MVKEIPKQRERCAEDGKEGRGDRGEAQGGKERRGGWRKERSQEGGGIRSSERKTQKLELEGGRTKTGEQREEKEGKSVKRWEVKREDIVLHVQG